MKHLTPEHHRLHDDSTRQANWRRWGPYLAERQWGTVREDYSPDGEAWLSFPHEHAPMRTYRWGEDGLLGICDRQCRLCFSLALWNGKDSILKERLFGLTNPQGNHGEDAKEVWYYLDSTPTHSYMRGLYKYPQRAFPYEQLTRENAKRGRLDPEFEIQDTNAFDENRYFDVFVEYAKDSPEDLLIRITIENRGPEAASLDVLPTLWFRNTWNWGPVHGAVTKKPHLTHIEEHKVLAEHETLGRYHFQFEENAPLLFTENETNTQTLYGIPIAGGFAKDGIAQTVVHGNKEATRAAFGTKVAPHYKLQIPAGGKHVLRLRLSLEGSLPESASAFEGFDHLMDHRREEADAFYRTNTSPNLNADQKLVVRQAYAGLLWSKQYYQIIVPEWLNGDKTQPKPPPGHALIRNSDWRHLYASDVLSMPDKWEYPWFAAWDLAFHMIPMARIDPAFAKAQLELLLREWYMHPSGQIPAYEWNFNDVNPPVHAWACWRVYKISGAPGARDSLFLERCFQKLLVNFTWWVNRKDVQGRHVFAGGFLGLDNIGLFDRSRPLPSGHALAQADGTAWMAFYCGAMLSMALELALERPAYEDIASKFFEHFIQIIDAMNDIGDSGLWNDEDGFYYDQLLIEGKGSVPLRTRSLVGIIPLLAVEVLDQAVIDRLPGFKTRMEWFVKNRPDLGRHVSSVVKYSDEGEQVLRLLAVPSKEQLQRVLQYVLDTDEFLSPWGVRSLSRVHESNPCSVHLNGEEYSIQYEPGESQSPLFGGNSNWRGPIWFPINYLLIEALERYHHFYGNDLKLELPTGSGRFVNLEMVSREIALRLSAIFTLNEKGHRPCFGENDRFADDPFWRDNILFHEYFHADLGTGLGANHQTGWTALITRCLGIVGKIIEE
ncbi:MAG: glucosidase [Verrucomicrobiota bacterium]